MSYEVTQEALTFIQGSTFYRDYTIRDRQGNVVDLSLGGPWAVRGQGRVAGYSTTKLFDLLCTITDPVNGGVHLELAAIDSANVLPPEFVADAEVESPTGFVLRFIQIKLTNSYEATK